MDLRDAIAQELCKFHRNACYPEASALEVDIAVSEIIKASAGSFTILPDCMMPDGGDPCQGYYQTRAKQSELETKFNRALTMIAEKQEQIDSLTADLRELSGPSSCGK